VSVPNAKTGQPGIGLYVEITDWDLWRPTELSIQMMRLACKYDAHNPFATAQKKEINLFMKIMGSTAFYNELATHGARTDVEAYERDWQARNAIYQQQSRKYWLYY
jgi:hypothetical protein